MFLKGILIFITNNLKSTNNKRSNRTLLDLLLFVLDKYRMACLLQPFRFCFILTNFNVNIAKKLYAFMTLYNSVIMVRTKNPISTTMLMRIFDIKSPKMKKK